MKKNINLAKKLLFAAALALQPISFASAQVDGKQIFENNCKTCHAIGEKLVGPDLKDVHKRRDEAWIKSFVSNSTKMIADGDKQAVEVYEAHNKIPMPSFSGAIDDEGLTAVINYIKAESEAPTVVVPETPPTTEVTPVPVKPFSIKDVPAQWLIVGSIVSFLLVLILVMMFMLLAQIAPVLSNVKDEKELENSWSLKWLALFRGDTRALTGNYTDVLVSEHSYDGITEFDNDLPPWWKYMFYISIVFSAAYLIHYHITNTGELQLEEYRAEMAHAALIQSANADDPNAKTNFTMLTAETDLGEGKKLYLQNCAACHGQSGEGTVGPNLTDEFWLHGGDVNDVFKTVKFGVPAKGMVPWNKKLTKDQILQVSSFILSLQGTNPANGKEPQGEKVALK